MEDSDYQALLDAGLTEEQIQAILELGLFPTEDAIGERESDLSTQDRTAPAPAGRRVAQDRIYVAADPTEHLARAVNRVMGTYRQRTLDAEARERAQEQTEARAEFLRALGGRGRASSGAGASGAAVQGGTPVGGSTGARTIPLPSVATGVAASNLRPVPSLPAASPMPGPAQKPGPYQSPMAAGLAQHAAFQPKPNPPPPMQYWDGPPITPPPRPTSGVNPYTDTLRSRATVWR